MLKASGHKRNRRQPVPQQCTNFRGCTLTVAEKTSETGKAPQLATPNHQPPAQHTPKCIGIHSKPWYASMVSVRPHTGIVCTYTIALVSHEQCTYVSQQAFVVFQYILEYCKLLCPVLHTSAPLGVNKFRTGRTEPVQERLH